ncbi:MAG: RagB/SusD family nutrient uptake outer membrane protein [Pedobacter sp.]|nr:RagB/SusD family nutrient uptake outer membrane protein [Pedobacter sp.]
MKRILFLLIATSVFSSCQDKLDIYPHSAVAPESITEKDLPALETGMYNKVQNAPPTESWILNDLIGGTLQSSTSTPLDLINNTLSPLSGSVSGSWNGYFSALYQVNNVLKITSNLSPSTIRNRVKGEAHYFRALMYYYLVTRWGAVPLLRENTLDGVPRSSVGEVWGLIEEDLDNAISLLGTSTNYYYVSKDAATALKARVKLTQNKMSEAAPLAESLITNGKYSLDGFEKIFRKIQNTEVIFAFVNNTEESSIAISNLFYTYAHTNKGSYLYRPPQAVMNMYSSDDKRKAISVDVVAGNNVINKYPSGQGGRDPVIISRLAEMYLISAEAKGRSAGLSRLNELRAFRGLTPVFPATDAEFIDAIINERRLELLAENFMYVDLIRTGRAKSVLGILDYQLLLPIPNTELRVNTNLTQNPGY